MKTTNSGLSWGVFFLCMITLCSAKDAHNRAVKHKLEEEILLHKENSYSKVLIDSKYFSCVVLLKYRFFQELFKDILSLGVVHGVN